MNNEILKIPSHMLGDISADKVPELLEAKAGFTTLGARLERLTEGVKSAVQVIDGVVDNHIVLGNGATLPEDKDLIIYGNSNYYGSVDLNNGIKSINGTQTKGNYGFGVIVADEKEIVINDTETTVSQFTPNNSGNFLVYIYLRIKNESYIDLSINYSDQGGAQKYVILKESLNDVSSISMPAVFINAKDGIPIKIISTASKNDSVYVSASIMGI